MDAVSQDNFEAEVIREPGKVLVDFWAESVSYTHLTLPTIYSV